MGNTAAEGKTYSKTYVDPAAPALLFPFRRAIRLVAAFFAGILLTTSDEFLGMYSSSTSYTAFQG